MKRLVALCDGTWNRADQVHGGKPSPTNVTKLCRAIADRDSSGVTQQRYYHPGVGTERLQRIRGGAFGYGLSRDVQDVYRFLVENFEPGDELFFFGFSRGAYTARSTVGFVRKCGILRRDEKSRVAEAFKLYRDSDVAPDDAKATQFREAHSFETRVRFIGVWDTVGSLGIPLTGPGWLNVVNRSNQFHDVKLSSKVDAAYQALAINEKRGPFVPAIWQPQPHAAGAQELEQVWFTGVHSDVGGGYPDCDLADLTLTWMVDRAVKHGLTLTEPFEVDVAKEELGRLHDSDTGIYKYIKPHVRSVGVTDPVHESVASTASARFEKRPQDALPGLVERLGDGKIPITQI